MKGGLFTFAARFRQKLPKSGLRCHCNFFVQKMKKSKKNGKNIFACFGLEKNEVFFVVKRVAKIQ